MILFKGKGQHSVEELETIIANQDELLGEKQLLIEKLRDALTTVKKWKFPETGKFWDEDKPFPKEKMSYGAAYGSNGERDYMKGIASEALSSAFKRPKTRGELIDSIEAGVECEVVVSNVEITSLMIESLNTMRVANNEEPIKYSVRLSPNFGWAVYKKVE